MPPAPFARLRDLARTVLGRDRFEREMRDEVRFHLEARAEDLARAGLPQDEAIRRARMEFGTVDAIKDDCRQSRGLRWLDELAGNLRYAVRLMAKAPGFTAAAVLSLALGIGANTAIFSLMDAVILRTIPVNDPAGLYFIGHGRGERPGMSSNYPLFEAYRSIEGVFSGLTAYSPTVVKVSSNNGLENESGLWVNGTFHGVVGMRMAHGRGFTAESDRPGAPPIAVISDAYWLRKFGRDPGVLDRSLTINNRSVAIVGVTAPEFTGLIPGSNPDITLPIAVRAIGDPEYLTDHGTWTDLTIVGRLAPGVTAAAALAPVDTVLQRYMADPKNNWIAKNNPDAFAVAALVPAARGSGGLRRQYETALMVLMGMVSIVLLIASVNVANLLLVRNAARAREVAIRMCVGGGRGRLIRQFLTESLLLAIAGGALGVVFAIWGTAAIMRLFNAVETPLLIDVSPSGRVLAFTGAISLLTGIAFGLVPAFASTRVDLTPALKEGTLAQRGRRWSMSHALVGSQVALSIVVLAIAALLARSLYNLKAVDAGFERGNLLLFTLDTNATALPAAGRLDVYRAIIERVGALPGVTAVSGSTSSPIRPGGNARGLVVPATVPDTIEASAAFTNLVSPTYFDTLGIRVLRGRVFTDLDTRDSQPVAVVNETMATFWAGDKDPLGMTLSFRGNPDLKLTIVGVVQDTHQMNLRDAPLRTVYSPLTQPESSTPSNVTVEVRTAMTPATLGPAIRDVVREVSRDVVLRYVRTIDEQINASLVRERVMATLSGAFAVLALVLSAIGLFGVMSYSVTRRSREIGIRMALGAGRGIVLGQVLTQTIVIAAIGTAVGVGASLFATRTLEAFLFGLSDRDPGTLAAVAIALLTTSFLAGLLPARRAATLDPVQAIKTE
jgi:predicted permease